MQPSFEVEDHGSSEAHIMKHPSDEEISTKPVSWLKTELKRRGFLRPPYTLFDAAGSAHTPAAAAAAAAATSAAALHVSAGPVPGIC